MRFREHRGLLASSLATQVEIEPTRSALVAHLRLAFRDWAHLIPDLAALEVSHYHGPDARIGWADTWVVSLPGYGVLGFTDREPGP